MKTCWMCEHFRYSSGGRGYSPETPGYDATMECVKKVWLFKFCDSSQEELVAVLTTAEHCNKFEKGKDA